MNFATCSKQLGFPLESLGTNVVFKSLSYKAHARDLFTFLASLSVIVAGNHNGKLTILASSLTIPYLTTVLSTVEPLIVTQTLLSPQKKKIFTAHLGDQLMSALLRYNISMPRIKFHRFLYIAVNITLTLIIHHVLLTRVKKNIQHQFGELSDSLETKRSAHTFKLHVKVQVETREGRYQ